MLRILKIILVLTVAFWGLVGGVMNFVHWGETIGSVKAVTTMSTFEGGAESWKATANPLVVWLGALFIPAGKLGASVLCFIGAYKMWGVRASDATIFAIAKQTALAGCAVAVFMLFGGFIVIAEGWFDLWRSDAMRGPVLGSAFRYAALIALIALLVATKDD